MDYLITKRILDLLFSIFCIILLLPIFVIIILLIKIDSKGPILFTQKRIGINKKSFTIYKFRTMKVETPKEIPTHKLVDANLWITKIGNMLRKTSLDELPQLINILKGDMSVVGPRPALWNQDDLITLRDKYNANTVPCGLTGLAQISGRDELNINRKAEIDGVYAENIGIKIDCYCFFMTFYKIFVREGYKEGS